MAAGNLRLGLSVVADSCNPIELTRLEWKDVVKALDADFVNVEVICSDKAEHRHRVETRRNTVANLVLPTWEEVVSREYHSWTSARVTVDTAGCTPDESYSQLRSLL